MPSGLFAGMIITPAGLDAGYVPGIFAGHLMQCLGWIASRINMLAGFSGVHSNRNIRRLSHHAVYN